VVAHAKTCSGRIWLWHTMMIPEQYIYIFICVCMYIDYVILINEYHDLDRLNYIIIKYWLILLMNAIVFFSICYYLHLPVTLNPATIPLKLI
jgi:hypothetical protein